MIHIFLIDDHSYINTGIQAALSQSGHQVEVVGAATSCREALEQLQQLDVDVVLLDIIMPDMDGICCCQELKRLFPKLKIVAFTGESDPFVLLKMWLEKVDGLLMKSCGLDDLVAALSSVMKNQKVIGRDVPGFFEHVDDGSRNMPKLTKSELEVLKLLGAGNTRKEASLILNRSMYSVDYHCKNIFKKFNSNRIHDILSEARKMRMIQ